MSMSWPTRAKCESSPRELWASLLPMQRTSGIYLKLWLANAVQSFMWLCLARSYKSQGGIIKCNFVRGWGKVAHMYNDPGSQPDPRDLCMYDLPTLFTKGHFSQSDQTAGIPRALGAALGSETWAESCILTTWLQGNMNIIFSSPWGKKKTPEFSVWESLVGPRRDRMRLCLWYWEIVNHHLSLSSLAAKEASAQF